MERFTKFEVGSVLEVLKLKTIVVAITLLLGMILADSVTSQDVAVGSATTIGVQAITVTSPQALDFGDILQGIPKSVTNNNGSAGIFEISGQNQAGINLYIQLPEYLSQSGSGIRLPIIFSAADASVDTTGAGNPAGMDANKGWQNVNPRGLPAAAIIGSNGTDIYIGGKVVPSASQKSGTYTGSVVLVVSYNDS
ncbi:MAG: hypothetical protein GY839_12750 [candidate division Zixibacteria bacterium]|nr:hypothetical protein [candidate division Zixibacteria bacterium]